MKTIKLDTTTCIIRLLCSMFALVMLSGCAPLGCAFSVPGATQPGYTGTEVQRNSNGTKVAAGTEVPFSKVMHPAFAADYTDCDIITVAQFVASGMGRGWMISYPMDDKVIFRCLPPGNAGEKNPLSGEVNADHVVIPKDKSDIVFTLKSGDLVRLRGGTAVRRMHPMINSTVVIFVATSIERYIEVKTEAQSVSASGASQLTSNVAKDQKGKEEGSSISSKQQKPELPSSTTNPPPSSTTNSGALDNLLR